jgi:hypothetical protein
MSMVGAPNSLLNQSNRSSSLASAPGILQGECEEQQQQQQPWQQYWKQQAADRSDGFSIEEVWRRAQEAILNAINVIVQHTSVFHVAPHNYPILMSQIFTSFPLILT